MKRCSLVFVWLFFSLTLCVSAIRKVCGTYTYRMPDNISLAQAKKMAIESAKIEALEKEFGSVVYQDSREIATGSVVRFAAISGSDVKGEWIEDISVSEPRVQSEKGVTSITVSVCGKAREIKRAPIDIEAKVLRNGTTADCESDDFMEGNDLYLLFRSPERGYLTVYLLDESGTAFCLLPYRNSPESTMVVDKGRQYVLFSKKEAFQAEQRYTDEYTLSTDKNVEMNALYLVFSPNEYVKANDKTKDQSLPGALSFEAFNQWLSKNLNRDEKMQVVRRMITIRAL